MREDEPSAASRDFVNDNVNEAVTAGVNAAGPQVIRPDGSPPSPPFPQVTTQLAPKVEPVIELNELVVKPENGHKPPARKWLDDYERAGDADGWSNEVRANYFATFLQGSAYDWLVTIARLKLNDKPEWRDLRVAFIRHFL